jgi:hypothetical protein
MQGVDHRKGGEIFYVFVVLGLIIGNVSRQLAEACMKKDAAADFYEKADRQ